jgi:hypothetical protein
MSRRPSKPFISFLMPTYGRCALQPKLLDEAVYWFSRQDYPNCELLILNDCKGQTLRCDVPRVTVVNSEYRSRSLGEKMNVMVELAPEGSVCAVYEDDDVILPWRASAIVKGISQVDFWSPGKWWFCPEDGPPVADTRGYGYTSCAFRRDLALDKHANVTDAHDQKFLSWANENLKRRNQGGKIPDSEVAYCYRWGVSVLHLSGTGKPDFHYKNYDPGKPGVYDILPAMDRDYLAETQAVLRSETCHTQSK